MTTAEVEASGTLELPQRALETTGGSVGFSKLIGINLTFKLSKRTPKKPEFNPVNYNDILRDLRQRHVILYDTGSKRGWMINGERATLQIILHRVKCRQNDFADPGIKMEVADPRRAASVKEAMEANKKVKLREDVDVSDGTTKDVLFCSAVQEIWERLRALTYAIACEYHESLVHNIFQKRVIGFEYRGLVYSYPDQEPAHRETLNNDCGRWPDLVRDLGAVVLFGTNFPSVLQPCGSIPRCLNCRDLPSGKSLLAVSADLILNLQKKHKGPLAGSGMSWIDSDDAFAPCTDAIGALCICMRAQELGIRANGHKNGEVSPECAIIFGARPSRKLSRRTAILTSEQPVVQTTDIGSHMPLSRISAIDTISSSIEGKWLRIHRVALGTIANC